jgi:hypothetical protein
LRAAAERVGAIVRKSLTALDFRGRHCCYP